MLRLKEIRMLKGKTQTEVAEYLKITRSAYSNIENNKRDPDSNTLFLLANFFDVPMDDLFGRTYFNERIDGSKFKLSQLRNQLHIKPQDLAKRLGITLSTYMSYEIGEVSPSIDVLIDLADLYKVSIDYLVGYSTEKQSVGNSESSDEEMRLVKDFRELNTQGKDYILQTVLMAKAVYKYSANSKESKNAM